jgi:hypothetical protein
MRALVPDLNSTKINKGVDVDFSTNDHLLRNSTCKLILTFFYIKMGNHSGRRKAGELHNKRHVCFPMDYII